MFLARSYSHHSLLSAVPKIPTLIANAKEKGYQTVAITDEDTTSGLVEFYLACQKEGVKPCLGTTLRIKNIAIDEGVGFGKKQGFSKIAIAAKNISGYKAILKLVSIARTIQEKPNYHLTLTNFTQLLAQKSELKDSFWVVLCGLEHELVAAFNQKKEAIGAKILADYIEVLGAENILVEYAAPLFDTPVEETRALNLKLQEFLLKNGVRAIVSPAPRYLDKVSEEAFRTILAIRDGKRMTDVTLIRDLYLPSLENLKQEYNYLKPEVFETRDLEDQINIQLRTDYDKHASEAFFPIMKLEPGQNAPDRLRWQTYIGMLDKFSLNSPGVIELMKQHPYENFDKLKAEVSNISFKDLTIPGYPKEYLEKASLQVYLDRIEYELKIIIDMGYSDYYLIFADIMNFCRQSSIVFNTRGSAAGSLAAYLCQISVLDPMYYQLPFERFLNPFRPSPPDIDGDFADDRRQEVIEYLRAKYGEDHVCQIVTFGTLLPRNAVRDVGRALGVPYKKCDQLSKLIPTAPQGRKTSFAWAFETSHELSEVYERDADAKRIIDIAKQIESNYRHASCHAAGVIIAPTETTDYAAVQWDSDHKIVACQYDMRVSEQIGLIKMDILGITNLSILGNAIAVATKRRNTEIDLLRVDTQNKATFELLSKGRTMGIFQLSGPAMTKYLVELEPSKIQDLMAMVALYRPGAMAGIPDYIKRKHNAKLVKYYVPQMKDWMEPSFGLFVYQEDLLFTAINLAGYNWGEVDVLRKGMGKKIQEVIDSQKPIFIKGAIEKSNLSEEKATEVWELMVPFGAYGFNKAHSSSYGMVSYWTAYMKAIYTVEYMTALMTAENSDLEKIAKAIQECRELGIQVLPPDINKSFSGFSIDDDNTIRYGLNSVKNLGSDVINSIIKEREQNGEFTDIENMVERLSKISVFNKRSLEALILSGSLDSIGRVSWQRSVKTQAIKSFA